jgi:hypothetical protein
MKKAKKRLFFRGETRIFMREDFLARSLQIAAGVRPNRLT